MPATSGTYGRYSPISGGGTQAAGGGGNVSSVGVITDNTSNGVFTNSGGPITGSPITTSGNMTLTFSQQAANTLFAGPGSGASSAPLFRTLVVNDFNGGSGASGSTFWRGDGTWATPAGGSASTSIFASTALNNIQAQASSTVFAGPASGAAAAPTFRALIGTDLPTLQAHTGQINLSQINATGSSGVGTYLRGDGVWATTSTFGGGGGANIQLSNLAASSVTANSDLTPNSDGGFSIGSTGFRWDTGYFKTKVGTGNLTFTGGQAFAALYETGAQSKPTLYLYDGSTNTNAFYANAGAIQTDFGGTIGKALIDINGFGLTSGFGRFGTSNSGNWKTMQIFGSYSNAGEQVVSTSGAGAFTVNTGVSKVFFTWASSATSMQVTLPLTVEDGQYVEFYSSSGTCAQTLTFASTGQTVRFKTPANGMPSGSQLRVTYRAGDTSWYGGPSAF